MSNVSLTASISQNMYSLQATQKLLDQTEYRVTTGKKVNSALDDPISYFKAQDHQQSATDLQSLKDDMTEAIQTIKAADAGISSIEDLISDAKSLATSAFSSETTAEATGYQTQFNALLTQITELAQDSGYSGVNLLGGSSQTMDVKFNSSSSNKITLTGVDASSTGLSLATATAWDTTSAGKTAITASIALLDAAKTTLRTDSKQLSNQLNTITTRQTFTDTMITALNSGSANLVNADTNEESVKLTTLQTQQDLAIQSLSIAKSASQSVLTLLK